MPKILFTETSLEALVETPSILQALRSLRDASRKFLSARMAEQVAYRTWSDIMDEYDSNIGDADYAALDARAEDKSGLPQAENWSRERENELRRAFIDQVSLCGLDIREANVDRECLEKIAYLAIRWSKR